MIKIKKNNLSYLKVLVKQQNEFEKILSGQGYCIICRHDDPLDLEYHHVAGKNNDNFVVSVCRNCHGRLSRNQRLWPKSWTQKNNPRPLREAFLLKGMAEIYELTAKSIFKEYENEC